ncbi:hypothetical protein AKJ09_11081 [Labilithrix luteola]|uniref:Uncharacterized protein n=1 Tax=Labilithrix luteola TaxID=1391654 RepID=A0A0K1QFB7_9BACT|nr:hypothetical protein AKJ09_11081 [Labilithrix luteola]
MANSHFEKRRRVKLRLRRGATHDLVASSRGRNEGGPRPTANGSMSHTDV